MASLNKSAIVLLCASWETYVEVVALECADRNITAAETPQALLAPIRRMVHKHIRKADDERTWENVTGNGWKEVARSLAEARAAELNTPKSNQVRSLFQDILGIASVERNWLWHRCSNEQVITRLDEFVTLRGAIAHGEVLARGVTKAQVDRAEDMTTRLVSKIEERLTAEGLLPA
ncbi:hypothetical protein HT585_20790 [Ensifer sp. HO-A22]|uniref:RiboL-PSP-HEPN domain-containing protein n=1 Tax=Ensifer oleiphilus TaxID=2742698 RepID=A0A7Y6Q924_9HYPH|nr:HEPN domain-containing protein [Ensifer oleiphilus]NVD41317.1 hypothetical protein [Ensifer oleiphilus]